MISFNSRTREGATGPLYWPHLPDGVSIHAPVKVRPRQKPLKKRLIKVSIHAPVKVRLFTAPDLYQKIVSIHAPVKVRLNPAGLFCCKECFNSRTREGATAAWVAYDDKTGFNSRTREGAT